MSELLVKALRGGLKRQLGHLAEADFDVYEGARTSGEALIEALERGEPVAGQDAELFAELIGIKIGALTWQTGFEDVPRPPWAEVGPRTREAQRVVDAAFDHLDEDTYFRLAGYIRKAEALEFRADYQVVEAQAGLWRGEAVRLPPMRPVSAPLGPTSWSASQGPSPRQWLSIFVGSLALALVQDRPTNPSTLELFAWHDARWTAVEIELGTSDPVPVEGLERVVGDDRFAGWHFGLAAPPALFTASVVDLQSPLAVTIQVPGEPLS